MSVLHHEALLETCFDEAVEEFMTANKLDFEMFRQIENHEGVMLAIEKNARAKFNDLLQQRSGHQLGTGEQRICRSITTV